MENGCKIGRAIKDKEILSIKKINKNMTITVDGRYNSGYDRYDIIAGSTIKITSVRKYRNRYYLERENSFVYEVDVEVDIKNTKFMNHSEYYVKHILSSRVRSINDYYRYDIKQYVMDDLKYCGVTDSCNTIISKIKYIH
jgi:phosphate-selective porin